MIRPCLTCEEEFESRTGGSRYCSARCCFLIKVEEVPESCWIWKAGKLSGGYGHFEFGKGNYFLAHRFAYELYHGPIPLGLHVLHHCDTPSCTNPEHLFVGTHRDNMIDRARKGRDNFRRPCGEEHSFAILTEEEVRVIRVWDGPLADLAARYGVAKSTIKGIRARQKWKHVL